MRIHDVLASKPTHDVVTVRPDATVRDLLDLLAEHNVGALVVSCDGTTVDGIVSERDVVRRLHADESLLEAPVSSIMTAPVHTCGTDATVDDLMSVMTERRFRHVPVVERRPARRHREHRRRRQAQDRASCSSSATSSTATCTAARPEPPVTWGRTSAPVREEPP